MTPWLLLTTMPRWCNAGARMAVLAVLFGSLVICRFLGVAGVGAFDSWLVCARVSLAVMFVFTATAHFTPMKRDLIAMVPPALPRPDLFVFATGIAELAGAVGLLIPATTFWAACGLVALMVA